jgi:hypothetical protein
VLGCGIIFTSYRAQHCIQYSVLTWWHRIQYIILFKRHVLNIYCIESAQNSVSLKILTTSLLCPWWNHYLLHSTSKYCANKYFLGNFLLQQVWTKCQFVMCMTRQKSGSCRKIWC